ncbi:DUF6602 domain-containing protein [Achromobacter insolitus]|uniref:DUF6602 domain-containing protein n=1 Tax=Achromobacter insolitus TaxID=217204 RepID=UPI0027E17DEE|nr:DUF6602 domain-containing protein [Achromobacter insolitus]MDQ6212127.1 hypothetical protein [Achromobacter insolitus]
MIKNASDLLTAFIDREKQKLASVSMPHMPTLGSAYEAIAKDGIDRQFVLPPGLDLRVVSGFIDGCDNQIDGMLVRGEGQRYGRTDQYIYPARQVLCVLEVKKTLDSNALDDGIDHLASILQHCNVDLRARLDAGEDYDIRSARLSYEKLTGRIGPPTAQAALNLPEPDRINFFTLFFQSHAPVGVLLGFDGYGTERGLRSAMLKVIESNKGALAKNFPEILPTLITAGTFSLVKCNGQPYLCRAPNGGWVLLASGRENVARILLELLWTKISLFCGVRMPFGTDLDHEYFAPLLVVEGESVGGRGKFNISEHKVSERNLRRPGTTDWEPRKLSAAAVDVARSLALQPCPLKLDVALSNLIHKKHGVVLGDAVMELVNTHAYCRSDTELRPIGINTLIVVREDGTGYADLNMDRLSAWCEKQGFALTPLTPVMGC